MATQNHPRPPAQNRLDKHLGITERIAPEMKGWTGELRVRYTDFQVHEISKDGTVVHLTDTKLPISELQGRPQAPSSSSLPLDGAGQPENAHRDANGAAKDETKDAGAEPSSSEKPPEAPEVPEEDIKILTDLTSEDFVNQVLDIHRAATTKQQSLPAPAKSPVVDDKDQRTQIHQQIRRIFRSVIDTTTDTSSSSTGASIVASGRAQNRNPRSHNNRNNNNISNNNRRGKKSSAGKLHVSGEGEYLHFTLYKENRDTMDAAYQLGRALRLKPQSFTFAGTKDRRAATAQRFCARGLRAQNLAGVNPRLRGVVTGNYRYEKSSLWLGALQGNEFVITLKNCELYPSSSSSSSSSAFSADANTNPASSLASRESAIRDSVTASLESMATRGWLNYYGHQRFGTHEVGTHEVGRHILQADFEGAANAILAFDEAKAARAAAASDNRDDGEGEPLPSEAHIRDDLNRAHACALFRAGGTAADALRFLPRRFAGEAAVMRHLGRDDGKSRRDFLGALLAVPRQLRNMYLHAYQSFVWNHAVSRRWAEHGLVVVEGDLVLEGEKDKDAGDAAKNGLPEEGEQPTPTDDAVADAAADDDEDAPIVAKARPLTAAEAASGTYTIHDVVLPTPGHSVTYPASHALGDGDFYADFMGRPENGALDPRDMARRQRDLSLPGHYRNVVARFLPGGGDAATATAMPRSEVRRYARDDEQMWPTDLDRVKDALREADAAGGKNKRKREEGQGEEGVVAAQGEGEDESNKKKTKVEDAGDRNVPARGEEEAMDVDRTGLSAAGVAAAQAAQAAETIKQQEGEQGENSGEGRKAEAAEAEKAKDKIAVIVRFRLGKSAYATVALRELMGVPEAQEDGAKKGEEKAEQQAADGTREEQVGKGEEVAAA